jgi:hypothetical protein
MFGSLLTCNLQEALFLNDEASFCHYTSCYQIQTDCVACYRINISHMTVKSVSVFIFEFQGVGVNTTNVHKVPCCSMCVLSIFIPVYSTVYTALVYQGV